MIINTCPLHPEDLANACADARSEGGYDGYRGRLGRHGMFETQAERDAYDEAYDEGADRRSDDAEERRNEARYGRYEDQHRLMARDVL